MGIQQTDDETEGPIETLQERLDSPPDDHDDVWEAFADRATDPDDFYRGGSVENEAMDSDRHPESTEKGGNGNGMGNTERSDPSDSPAHLDLTDSDDGIFNEVAPDAADDSQGSIADDPLDELINRDDERLEPDDDVRRVRDGAQEFVVPKDDYCEQCPHYRDPPDVGCSNEGTEIVEFEDMVHVRIRNCPVVNDNPLAPDPG